MRECCLFLFSLYVCASKYEHSSYRSLTSPWYVCAIGFSPLFDTLSSVQFAFTLIPLKTVLHLFKHDIFAVWQGQWFPEDSMQDEIHPMKSVLTYLCVSLCKWFLMRLLRRHWKLKMRSPMTTASGDNPTPHSGTILLPFWPRVKIPVTLHNIYPNFPQSLKCLTAPCRLGLGGCWGLVLWRL